MRPDNGSAQIVDVRDEVGQEQGKVDEGIVVDFEEELDVGTEFGDHLESEERLERHVVVVVDEVSLDDVVVVGVLLQHGRLMRITQSEDERQAEVAHRNRISTRSSRPQSGLDGDAPRLPDCVPPRPVRRVRVDQDDYERVVETETGRGQNGSVSKRTDSGLPAPVELPPRG